LDCESTHEHVCVCQSRANRQKLVHVRKPIRVSSTNLHGYRCTRVPAWMSQSLYMHAWIGACMYVNPLFRSCGLVCSLAWMQCQALDRRTASAVYKNRDACTCAEGCCASAKCMRPALDCVLKRGRTRGAARYRDQTW
jgi:hypothetical protein